MLGVDISGEIYGRQYGGYVPSLLRVDSRIDELEDDVNNLRYELDELYYKLRIR